jgi:tRNA(Ile2) C34 agmatinyltransferase TiaS
MAIGLRQWKCDRNGGQNMARYMRRRVWDCPHCGDEQHSAGHRCQDCHRRICCSCFHHDIGICLSGGGSDVEPTKRIAAACQKREGS